MKISHRFLGVLVITLLLNSCQQETPEKLTIIEGTFENATTTKAYLAGHLKAPGNVELDENGTFRDTLDIESDGYFVTGVNRDAFSLFIVKGKTTTFSVDFDAQEPAIKLTAGGNQSIIDYLSKKRAATSNPYSDVNRYFGKEPEAFKIQIDSVFGSLKRQLSTIDGEVAFKSLEEQSLKIEEIQLYNRYPNYYKYAHNLEEFETPDSFKEIANTLDKDNELYAQNFETYRNMILNEVMDEAYEKGGDTGMMTHALDILKNKKSNTLKDNLVNTLLFMFSPTDNLEIVKNDLMGLANTDKTKKAIVERYDKIKHLVQGKPSPTFNYENFKGGKTALEDLKGKYVYIDVWATWCGPCIAEIPSLKKLEHDYEGKNIEFVSISVDDKNAYNTWRKMVTNKELGGSQLMADDNFESKFVQDYAIDAIPRFILLDPNGNIVSADAQRPSNENITEQFTALGIK